MELNVLDAQGPQDILAALDFIARNFDQSVLQSAYEIIQHGSAALPGEMVAAAVFLQNGDISAHMSQMAAAGHLMCFYTPREMGEVSPLAVCTVIECGKTSNFYSTRFGLFGPEETFSRAKAYSKQRNVTIAQALQRVTVSEEIGMVLPGMAKALSDIFKRCPAVAARITFDADQDRMHRIYASHHKDNFASGKVMLKNRMKKERIMRGAQKNPDGPFSDLILYAILSRDR